VISIEHHKGQSSITFQGVGTGKGTDTLFFVVAEPVIARDPVVMFVDLTKATFPVLELAGGDADPG
jgi:hypothetical protein